MSHESAGNALWEAVLKKRWGRTVAKLEEVAAPVLPIERRPLGERHHLVRLQLVLGKLILIT